MFCNVISFRCPFEETLNPWLFQMGPEKILIRVCECAD